MVIQRTIALLLVAIAVAAALAHSGAHGGSLYVDTLRIGSSGAPSGHWPWLPKNSNGGPYAAPTKIVSIASGRPRARWSYDWPLKPFDQPHPVRAYLNEPRVSTDLVRHDFHFGVDITAQGGTPVFAIDAGRVHYLNKWAVGITTGARTFEYWHIVSGIREGKWVPRHAVLGHTRLIFNHLHLSERQNNIYVNPLRAGALGPFSDSTSPVTTRLSFRNAGKRRSPRAVRGTVDLVADSADIASDVKPYPWPVAPALLQWRILRGGRVVSGWKLAYDFRTHVLPSWQFGQIYADGTRMNHAGWAGYYCFNLTHGWKSTNFRNGTYRLEVQASDIRGNVGISYFSFTIAN